MTVPERVFLPGLSEAIQKAVRRWLRDHFFGRPVREQNAAAFLEVAVATMHQAAANLAHSMEEQTSVTLTEERFLALAREAWARRSAAE